MQHFFFILKFWRAGGWRRVAPGGGTGGHWLGFTSPLAGWRRRHAFEVTFFSTSWGCTMYTMWCRAVLIIYVWVALILGLLRIGHCKGFALGTYLLFNVAAMLWQVRCIIWCCKLYKCEMYMVWWNEASLKLIPQVCAALAIFHILPSSTSFSHNMTPGTERFVLHIWPRPLLDFQGNFRFLSKWGAWLAASYISCLPVQLVSSALYLSFDDHQVKIQVLLSEISQWLDETLFTRRRTRRVFNWGPPGGTWTEGA